MVNLADIIRMIAAKADDDTITMPFRPEPESKPARRQPSFQNKSQHKNYQRDYKRKQKENGGGYQKVPDKVKEWRREQRKTLKDKEL